MSGKGDNRRPACVDDAQYARSWCAAFGHRRISLDVCLDCGMSEATARERGEQWGAAISQADGNA